MCPYLRKLTQSRKNYDMTSKEFWLHSHWMIIGVALLLNWAGMMGCSKPPPPPQPSKQEIRSDADRLFNKLEKEQQNQEDLR